MDELLSVDEAARRLGGLSKYTMHAWLSSGKLRRTKVGSYAENQTREPVTKHGFPSEKRNVRNLKRDVS